MKIKIFILTLIFSIAITSTYIISANKQEINLNGFIIYIDAGHGGKDNGANYQNILEDEINFNISNYLLKGLVEKGAIVYTTRDGDYDLASNYDKNRKYKDLKKRVELINKIKPHLFLSIHLNTYPNEDVNGGQIFFQNNKDSETLANILQDKFNKLSNKDKKAKKGDYYLLNNTKEVGVIVECGFLTNPQERKKLIDKRYQVTISESIIEGIFDYFRINI